jgi:hypothetical protein
MAISVPVPKEITEYEEKILFGLSRRKLLCFLSAAALGTGTCLLCTKAAGLTTETAGYLAIAEALPLMALGFIRPAGMPAEQYLALLIRHKTGRSQLPYETEPIIDALPGPSGGATERRPAHAWIPEKETGAAGTGRRPARGRRRARAAARECPIPKITQKSRKRKGKEARRTAKAAGQERRAAQRRAQEAAKESGGPEKHRAAGRIREDVRGRHL